MDIELIWIFTVCLISLTYVSTLPSYSDMCGKTIFLDQRNLAVNLIVPFDYNERNYDCHVMVRSEPEFQIAYLLNSRGPHDPFKDCELTLSFDDQFRHYNVCFDSDKSTHGRVTRNNELDVHIKGDLAIIQTFEIQFVSVRIPENQQTCRVDEYLCGDMIGWSDIPPVCLEYSLICHETQILCITNGGECSDLTSTNSGTQNYTYIIIAAAFAFFLLLSVMMIVWRRHRACRGASGGRNSSSQEIRSRAMAIFSTQLATRGVDSADGNDNRAYLDEDGNPIDFSKFDPPPEYGSLEHLDNIGMTSMDIVHDEEEPPCYDQVMNNCDDFKVTTNV